MDSSRICPSHEYSSCHRTLSPEAQQCLGPKQRPRPTLPKVLIPRGYYQQPKRLLVAGVQLSQAARSAASSPYPLTAWGTQAPADLHRLPQGHTAQHKQALHPHLTQHLHHPTRDGGCPEIPQQLPTALHPRQLPGSAMQKEW